MTSSNLVCRLPSFGVAVCLCILALAACEYEVPITSSPTRKVEERLLGDWTSADGKEKMNVRSLDESIYVVYYDGDLFRAYHSDIGDIRFAVQDLNSKEHRFTYLVWQLSKDGKSLRLRNVNSKVIPKDTKDSAAVVALLKENAGNPELFGEEMQFNKEK